MIEIFLKTLPFFALIGVGYGAGRLQFFSEQATAYLTKFVFYFALSAMLFRFSANLSFAEIFDARLAMAYLWGTAFAYGVGMAVAFWRGLDTPTAAIEAQCAAIGNTGFLGVPMLAVLLGQEAIGPIILILAIDLIVFSSALTLLVTGSIGSGGRPAALRKALMGLLQYPLIVSISLGLIVSFSALCLPSVAVEFMVFLCADVAGHGPQRQWRPGSRAAQGADGAAEKPDDRLDLAGADGVGQRAWPAFGGR